MKIINREIVTGLLNGIIFAVITGVFVYFWFNDLKIAEAHALQAEQDLIAIKEAKQKIILEHGSLLLMKGTTQHFWKHQIPKTAKPIGPRINATFRVIK